MTNPFFKRSESSSLFINQPGQDLIFSNISVPINGLWIRHVFAEMIPVNGSAVQVATLRLIPPGSPIDAGPLADSIQLERIGTPGTSMEDGIRKYPRWIGDIFVPGEWTIQGYGVFSNNTVKNTIILHVIGLEP